MRAIRLIPRVIRTRKPPLRRRFETVVSHPFLRLPPLSEPYRPSTFFQMRILRTRRRLWGWEISIGAFSKTKKPPLSPRFRLSFSSFPWEAPERRKVRWECSLCLPEFRLRRKGGISQARIFPRSTSRNRTVSFRRQTASILWFSKAILRP